MDVADDIIISRLSNRRSCKKCGQVYNLIFEPPKNAGKCDDCDGILFLREDDNPNTIQQRLNVYHELTEPLVRYYKKQGILKAIDGTGSPENIYPEIKQILNEVPA